MRQPTLTDLFNSASTQQRLEGEAWYFNAQVIAITMSEATGYTLAQVAGVISALSPLKSWDTNLTCASDFLNYYKLTGGVYPCHFMSNLVKAQDILESDGTKEAVETYFKQGTKTHHFFLNIMGDWDEVTWDGHMINMVKVGTRVSITANNSKSSSYLPKKLKAKAMAEMSTIASDNDLQLAQVQAVLWTVYREKAIQ